MKLTREQRQALHSLYLRGPLVYSDGQTYSHTQTDEAPLTYRQFRRCIKPAWDCIMVPWCGMWLGIETDGYTHS